PDAQAFDAAVAEDHVARFARRERAVQVPRTRLPAHPHVTGEAPVALLIPRALLRFLAPPAARAAGSAGTSTEGEAHRCCFLVVGLGLLDLLGRGGDGRLRAFVTRGRLRDVGAEFVDVRRDRGESRRGARTFGRETVVPRRFVLRSAALELAAAEALAD